MNEDQINAAESAIQEMMLSCGPLSIDVILRQGMLSVWQSLKEEDRNAEFFINYVERKYQQILNDFKEDYKVFRANK